MGQYDGLIFAVNTVCGTLLSMLLGVAAARTKPDLARAAKPAMLAFLASALAMTLFALPLHPVAALVALGFVTAAWAAAPLEACDARLQRIGWAMGVGGAAVLGIFSGFDLWWTIPLLGLLVGFLRALWQARPDFLRKPEDREAREEPLGRDL